MRAQGRSLPEEELTREIIGAFFYVYNTLRYGFLESVYANALAKVLHRGGHHVAREIRVPVWFEGEIIGHHHLDMIIDGKVVVETKATERLADIADRQLRSYLTATRLEVGLILHFGSEAKAHRVKPGRRASHGEARSTNAYLLDPADPQYPQ
jgi:GxxExxY protein